ncbi:MAG: hypothetical protein HUK20_10285 [Fibrobacter sp.]|nr:hypothetical protein [Fibrobacter sp.]
MANNKVTIALCEGESEFAYIQELNRFLRENENGFVFVPRLIGSGHYSDIYAKYKEQRKSNPKGL